MASPKAQLEALLALINESAHAAIAEYEKTEAGVPSPYDTNIHPLDEAEDPLALKKAIRTLEGAFDQLCATLAPPSHTLFIRAQDYYWACLSVAQQAHVAEALRDHPEGLPVTALAEKTGIASRKLVRILRMLASRSVFVEVSPEVFANNRLSSTLITRDLVGDLVEIYTVEGMAPTVTWYNALIDPEYSTSFAADKSAWRYSVKDHWNGGGAFEYLKEHPARRELFGRAMVGLSHATGSLAAIHHFPWGKYKHIVDVGSGIGTFSLQLAKANNDIRVTLHDLPNTIDHARAYWGDEYPEAVQTNRVNFEPLDFFSSPPAAGLDVYFYRFIIHNWPDEKAVVILKNARAAMTLPSSRLLIQEFVLHNPTSDRQSPDDNRVPLAPEPMLPNFGAGNIKHYAQDITMLILYNAKERTLDEFAELGNKASLKLEKVWDLADTSLLEFVAV